MESDRLLSNVGVFHTSVRPFKMANIEGPGSHGHWLIMITLGAVGVPSMGRLSQDGSGMSSSLDKVRQRLRILRGMHI